MVVGQPVGGVVVLVGIKVQVGGFGMELLGDVDGAVGALARVGEHQVNAVSAQRSLALNAGVGWQGQLDAIAPRCTDPGVSYTCVA